MEFEMDMSQFAGDVYLRVEDVRESGPVQVTIVAIEDGVFDKPVAVLSDGNTCQLNQTNIRSLIRHWGPNSDDWHNKEIELSVGQTTFNGELVDTIVVRPISPAIPLKGRAQPTLSARPASLKSELNDDIPF
jgi:hypothetical protein